MKFVMAVTTFQRLEFLKRCLETWDQTRNREHEWTLIVADDGSGDGTVDYLADLELEGVELRLVLCARRGVHHMVNQILLACLDMDFDFGFKTDDDLYYLAPGWDDAYYKAAMETGYHHLVHCDPDWRKGFYSRRLKKHESGLLESRPHYYQVQGAFWTFTKAVIEKVGFYDLQNFGLCHQGHVDYSVRCALLGFNDPNRIFDIVDSNNYIRLVVEGYRGAISRKARRGTMNGRSQRAHKMRLIKARNRGYVPYNEAKVNMLLEEV